MSENKLQMNIEEKPTTPVPENVVPDKSTDSEQKNGITLQLLVNIKQLLDIAIKRGAYQPNELSSVGQIYDQFNSGLEEMVKIANKNNE